MLILSNFLAQKRGKGTLVLQQPGQTHKTLIPFKNENTFLSAPT